MEYKPCCVGSVPMLRPVGKTALLAAVVVAAANPSAGGQTIIPISQRRSTHTAVFTSQCNQSMENGDLAPGFAPFTSSVGANVTCADGSAVTTATQQSDIQDASITASGRATANVTAVTLGLNVVMAHSDFTLTFQLMQPSNFTLDGMISAHALRVGAFGDPSTINAASIRLERSDGVVIFTGQALAAADLNHHPFSESGVLAAGVYTLSASAGLLLDNDVPPGGDTDESFDFVFLVSPQEMCTPVARFQGLGDLPGGNVHSGPTEVSSDGTAAVGESSSTASGGNPEAFLWTQERGIIGLGDLGGLFQSLAWGVSADGSVVVGQSLNSQGFNEAFRWTEAAGMVGLGDLPGGIFSSRAFAVSADGSVVLGLGRNSLDRSEAFRWTEAGGIVGLGALPGGIGQSSASVMSPDGSIIIGNSISAGGPEAFRWTEAGGMVGLGDLPGGTFFSQVGPMTPDGSVIVGNSSSGNAPQEAFRWTQAGGMVGLGVIPGGEGSFVSTARAVTPDGSVIVGQSSSANGVEAFRWTAADGMVGLGDLPGGIFESSAHVVSPDGSIVIGSGCTELVGPADPNCCGATEAFIWDAANGIRKLQDALVNELGLNLTGWKLESVTAMTPDGHVIIGTGTNPNGDSEGWIATIGSPAGACCLAAAPVRPATVVAANRYLSLSAGLAGTSVALRVTFVSLPPPFDQFDGLSMWVGPPESVSELPGVVTPPAAGPAFTAATLQCTPLFADWSTHGTIRIFHEDIVPGGIYDIQVIDQRCNPVNEAAFSAPLTMATATWGDLVGPFDPQAGVWTAPDGSVDVTFDAVAQINKFMGLGTAPIKARADLEPALPDQLINITDIVVTLDAFKGRPFPFAPGPIPCGG